MQEETNAAERARLDAILRQAPEKADEKFDVFPDGTYYAEHPIVQSANDLPVDVEIGKEKAKIKVKVNL